MHLLDLVLNFPSLKDSKNFPTPHWSIVTTAIAPVITLIISVVNLFLAIYIFGYTRKKNQKDVNIKWFLELIYIPSKDYMHNYFKNLIELNKNFPMDKPWTEDQKILILEKINKEENEVRLGFIEVLQSVSEELYKNVLSSIESLTTTLSENVDNDELNLQDPDIYEQNITSNVLKIKNKIIKLLYNFQG